MAGPDKRYSILLCIVYRDVFLFTNPLIRTHIHGEFKPSHAPQSQMVSVPPHPPSHTTHTLTPSHMHTSGTPPRIHTMPPYRTVFDRGVWHGPPFRVSSPPSASKCCSLLLSSHHTPIWASTLLISRAKQDIATARLTSPDRHSYFHLQAQEREGGAASTGTRRVVTPA